MLAPGRYACNPVWVGSAPGLAYSAASRKVGLDAYWDDGLWFESANKQFRLHVGGSAQIDSTWLIGPQSAFALPNGGANGIGNAAGTFLRRARFRAVGDIFEQFDYIVEYDFANASNENNGEEPPSFSNLTSAPVPTNMNPLGKRNVISKFARSPN